MTTPNPDRRIGEMQAGPELDRLVAELMGWSIGPAIRYDMVGNEIRYKAWVWPGYNDDNDFAWGVEEWRPSANIAHAWEVVEKMRADHISIGITWTTGRFGECQVNMCRATMCEPITYTANALTAPLAICRAALAATSPNRPTGATP